MTGQQPSGDLAAEISGTFSPSGSPSTSEALNGPQNHAPVALTDRDLLALIRDAAHALGQRDDARALNETRERALAELRAELTEAGGSDD